MPNIMPSFQTLTLITCLSLGVMAASNPRIPSSIKARTQNIPRKNSTTITLTEPTMYKVYPTMPDISSPSHAPLEVERQGNVSVLENIAVFEGIPLNAKTCSLGWVQSDISERPRFDVDGNGLLAVQQLTRLVARDTLKYEDVAPIVDESVEQGKPLLHPETTGWPEVESQWKHVAGFVDCAGTVYFKLQVDDRSGDGYVYLSQSSMDGLTLEIGFGE